MFDHLGTQVARHPWLVVTVWLAVTVSLFAVTVGGVAGESLFDRLVSGEPDVAGSQSAEGGQILADESGSDTSLALAIDGVDPADPALVEPMRLLNATLAELDGVASVIDPYVVPDGPADPAVAGLLAENGEGFLVVVELDPDLAEGDEQAALDHVEKLLLQVAADLSDVTGSTVSGQVGGESLIVDDITHQVEQDLITGEAIALPVALAVMVLVFGGFVLAGMPLAGAIASIGGGLGIVMAMSYRMETEASVVNIVTILGLGLSIDYGLLIVSRFREELHTMVDPDSGDSVRSRRRGDAVIYHVTRRTMQTAGRTVVFSALTVAVSISGLLVFTPEILRAFGGASVGVILVAVATAITLVPALLVIVGRRLNKPGIIGRIPGLRALIRRTGDVTSEEGVFSLLASRVQRHPWIIMLGALAILGFLALPLGHLQLRNSATELLPADSAQRAYLETISEEYPTSQSPTGWIVAEAPVDEVTAWTQEVVELPEVASVDPLQPLQTVVVVPYRVDTDDAGGAEAVAAVRAILALDPPFQTWVTGQAANQIDFIEALTDRMWWAAGIVVLATFVLLFLMTRSVVIPIKALLTNALSLSASLGVLVWVFQDGHLSSVLSFQSTGGIETYVIALVVAFAFGLAMDYEVFLLSRIKELWDSGASNDDAVRRGLQRSGRIITSAAVIIVVVFTGFVFGELLIIKEVGFSLAVAVTIDATLVRMLLVPATMTVLGRLNWWAPAWLLRATRRFAIEH